MTINTLFKKTILRLKDEGTVLTPEHYTKAFCQEAHQAGFAVPDCDKVDEYTNTLNSDLQKEVRSYRVKTTQELIRFLISKINRATPKK